MRRGCTKSFNSLILMFCRCPGGGMADAEDLKSSGDFSSCGFDSHPGHQSFLLKMNELLAAPFRVLLVYPTLQKNERITAPGVSQIRFQLFLSRAHPRCVMLLGNSHALVA